MKSYKYQLNMHRPLSLAVLFVGVSLLILLFYIQNDSIDRKEVRTVSGFSTKISNEIERDSRLFNSIIDILKEDPKLQNLFLAGDREKLYHEAYPVYLNLNKNMDVTHFYFIGKDGSAFLRMHDLNRHSDIIDRFTFKQAQSTGKPFSGIEFGIKKNFTLRIVQPWIVDGEIIGYIELGREIDKIITDFSKSLNTEIYIAIEKNVYKNSPAFVKENLSRAYQTKEHYIVYNTFEIPDEINTLLENKHSASGSHVSINDRWFHMSLLPLNDVSKRQLGYYILLIDITQERALLHSTMGLLVIAILGFSIFVLIVSLFFIRKREAEINLLTEKLHDIAITDELSGLYNRKYFNEQVPLEIRRAIRTNLSVTMIMVDIDNFKRYNDMYGHQAGDAIIQTVSKMIRSQFDRAGDLCFRIGGEEFAIVFAHVQGTDAVQAAQLLRERIESIHLEHMGNEPYQILTISLGVVTGGPDTLSTMEKLYKMADEALYEAKNNGRNRIEHYTQKPV